MIIENYALTRLLHQVYCGNKLCQITDCVINLLKKVLERKSIINDELLTSRGSMSYVLKVTVLPIFCCFNDLLIANPVNCKKRSPLVFASHTSLAKNTSLENIQRLLNIGLFGFQYFLPTTQKITHTHRAITRATCLNILVL